MANNASSNDVAIGYVKKKTKERDSSILGDEFINQLPKFRMQCDM